MEYKLIPIKGVPLEEESKVEPITISAEEAKRISLVSELIEDNPEDVDISVHLHRKELEKIVEYVRILNDVPEPTIEAVITTHRFAELVPEQIQKLMKLPKDDLFELMAAADFLKMEKLLSIIGARIACHLMKMSDEEKQEYLGLEDDLTLEEKANIHRENQDLRMLLPDEDL
eukprot:CAMPEP_0168335502 /NCGR_PEP_ID=MMETSP0213-20121227/10950_1 /TAXON_ID=151035 /ORGANISM="Euplotes harpa, Strain FSP1.4" /LENGTH=172 /DNA_ID=CAMNT_0008340447 /DNA_START=34 /DNA_END=552 /DNA_ORIENTATION=+